MPRIRRRALPFGRAERRAVPGLVSLAALLAAVPAAGQRLPFQRFDAEDGLAGSQIWDLRQDRRGLLWVAGTWGFSVYDGAQFDTLSTREGLPSPNARTVIEDRDGNLWLGTNDGVARFDGRTVTVFDEQESAPRGTVWASAIDGAGRLWFGTERGLVRHADGRFRRFGAADGLADDYVYSLQAARDGTLWIGSRGAGLARCTLDDAGDLAACRRLTRRDGLGSDVVRAFAEDDRGRMLVGTRGGGVTVFDGERATRVGATDGLPSDDVYALLVRRQGVVVVGTADRGLALCLGLLPPRCRTVAERNGLPEDGVRSLLEDREGSLWVGTEGGLAQLLRDDLWSYGEGEGLASRHVYALAPDGVRGLWVGGFGGLTRLGIGSHGEPTTASFVRDAGLPARWVWGLAVDGAGGVWVGTEGGLCRMAGGRCVAPSGIGELAAAYVLSLAMDADGVLWAGTTTGVHRLRLDDGGEVVETQLLRRADGLLADRTYGIVGDAEGRVFLAHGEGLSIWEAGRARAVGVEEGPGWRALRGLGVDAAGRALLGGYGRLARVESAAGEPLRLRRWDGVPELSEAMILTLASAPSGDRLLLGTNRGVLLFDPEARQGAGAIVAKLDARGGAIATEVSHSGAFVRDPAGRLWFGFKGGVTGVLAGLATAPPAPEVAFSRLESKRGRTFAAAFTELGAAPVGWLEASRPLLPHDDPSLRVWVRAPTYVRRDDLRFQFRWSGPAAEWSGARAEPFLDLMNLPAGRHVVEARAAYADGAWGPPAALEFEIAAAWWQSPFLPLTAVVLGGSALAALVGLRGRRIRRLEVELERRIAERTEDLARHASALAEHLQAVDRVSDRMRRAEVVRRDLFARASHELRTPLTAVLGFSELLDRSLADRLDEKEQRYLSHVRESGELLLRQVNEVLEHFRLESGRVEVHLDEVALAATVESVVSLMEGFALHRGVRLQVRVEEAPAAVRVDVAKLRQVLMNLLSNAIKFSPAGATVEISVRGLAAGANPWRRPAYEVTVRDRGAGIPAEELETIFEPYRRLPHPSAAPGTGLGLPIARQLVQLLGGTLTVESSPGAGATFAVRLPVDPDPIAPLAEGGDSGAFDAERAQIVVLEPDWERFAELARGLADAPALALRVESLELLERTLGGLRAKALVVPFDAAADGAAGLVTAAVAAARTRGMALVLMPRRAGRALVLGFARVLAADAGEAELRLALRAAGAGPRSFGRRPLVLVATTRAAGGAVGATLGAAGCDHFRVEGANEVRAALAETLPDAGLVDLAHACGLAVDPSPRGAAARRRVLGWILLDVAPATAAELATLTRAVEESGAAPVELLRETLAPILGDATTEERSPAPETTPSA